MLTATGYHVGSCDIQRMYNITYWMAPPCRYDIKADIFISVIPFVYPKLIINKNIKFLRIKAGKSR
nr:hypothetical protein [Enterobacter asburiae]